MKATILPLAFLMLGMLTACNEESTTLGGDLMPQTDGISTTHATYALTTRTVPTGALAASTSRSYLGSVIDPETGVRTTSGYLAQFHTEDNTTLPPLNKMITDAEGRVVADSCVLYINHDSYFGDSLNVMKLSVHELDKAKALSEAESYSTNIDPTQYLMGEGAQRKTVTYTALDQTKSVSTLNNSNFYRQVAVRLNTDYGTKILRQYYAHPEHFKNSYEFARNVCAGFYFKHEGGVGTMLSSPITTLNIYYRQHTKNAAGNDTIVNTMLRVGSTEEVIQTSNFENELPDALLTESKGYTYVKSPAALHTEGLLPIDEIAAGKHYNDTINSVRLVLRAHKGSAENAYRLPPSQQLLLLPKSKAESFFAGGALPDGVYSYLASYDKGTYTYSNIAALVSALRLERDLGAKVLPSDSETVRMQKWAAWEANHPDWNKVVLLPVVGDYSTSTVDRQTIKTLQRLRHNFGLTSVRLEGGPNHPIELSVIYSRFSQ